MEVFKETKQSTHTQHDKAVRNNIYKYNATGYMAEGASVAETQYRKKNKTTKIPNKHLTSGYLCYITGILHK